MVGNYKIEVRIFLFSRRKKSVISIRLLFLQFFVYEMIVGDIANNTLSESNNVENKVTQQD